MVTEEVLPRALLNAAIALCIVDTVKDERNGMNEQAADQALQQMYTRYRDRAVEAIVHKNHLHDLLQDKQKQLEDLRAYAALARERGHPEQAQYLVLQQAEIEPDAAVLQERYARAVEAVDRIKAQIQAERRSIEQRGREEP